MAPNLELKPEALALRLVETEDTEDDDSRRHEAHPDASVSQHATKEDRCGDQECGIAEPGGPDWIDLTTFGHILAHHYDWIVDGQDRQKAEQKTGQELILGHQYRERTT